MGERLDTIRVGLDLFAVAVFTGPRPGLAAPVVDPPLTSIATTRTSTTALPPAPTTACSSCSSAYMFATILIAGDNY